MTHGDSRQKLQIGCCGHFLTILRPHRVELPPDACNPQPGVPGANPRKQSGLNGSFTLVGNVQGRACQPAAAVHGALSVWPEPGVQEAQNQGCRNSTGQ